MAPRSWRSLRTIVMFLCVLLVAACQGGGGGPDGYGSTDVQAVIGPEGGSVEVTDPGSSLNGLKITVPPGAVSQKTTFSITFYASNAPDLPAGLSGDYPVVQLGPSATFPTYLEVTFPVTYIPTGDGDILGAYCWNPTKAHWVVNPARHVDGARLTVSTNQLALCRWGTVHLDQVDDETVKAWMDDLQGMVDNWESLKASLMARIAPFVAVVEQPSNLVKCSTQNTLLTTLGDWRADALAGVTSYLTSAAIVKACQICDRDGTCITPVCDANAIISGQPVMWAQREIQIWMRSLFVSSACPVDLLGPLVEKFVAWGMYQEAIRELRCDWRCILKNGNLDFYVDLLVGNVCSFSIFGIALYQSEYGCM